jgi:hypothetical protein
MKTEILPEPLEARQKASGEGKSEKAKGKRQKAKA